MKTPSFYPRWQQYNTCLAAPTVTWRWHCNIEPKAKHFCHYKKNQSSWPNQTDSSKRITKISNHAEKNSEKIQLIFIDKLIVNPQFIGSQQTHRKRILHRIDLQEHQGEHGIENQRERRSHLANNYGPHVCGKLLTLHRTGNGVDVEALCDRIPLRQDAEKGP